MYIIESPYTDPYTNLALEEFCFDNIDEDIIMLWQNDNTIVVGKYQNTIQEISTKFVKDNNIKVVRRLSGGGAVYHDLGNLNFTIIKGHGDKCFEFEYFTRDIIDILAGLGVKSGFNSRNDLVIDGRKFSGNSQYIKKEKILHHGTLLFDSDLDVLVNALNVSGKKIESKAIKSVHERVTNIRPHLPEDMEFAEFLKYVRDFFINKYDAVEYELGPSEMNDVRQLKEDRYSTWDWNYGTSPASSIVMEGRFKGGNIEVYLDIDKGYLRDISIYGDFFVIDDIEPYLQDMKGEKFDEESLGEDINRLSRLIDEMDSLWLKDLIFG